MDRHQPDAYQRVPLDATSVKNIHLKYIFRKLVKVNPLQSLEYKALFNVCLCLIFTLLFYFPVYIKLAISKTFLLAGLLARD